MDKLLNGLKAFAAAQDGAQIIEYALLIAVISLALIALLMPAAGGLDFAALITRVNTCLSTGTCT